MFSNQYWEILLEERMLTYSVRAAQKGAKRSKLHGYQSIGIKAAEVRAKNKKPLDKTKRLVLEHRSNAYEAFIHVNIEK